MDCRFKASDLLLPSADSCNGGLQNGLGTHGQADQPEVGGGGGVVRSSYSYRYRFDPDGAGKVFSLAKAVGGRWDDGILRWWARGG